MGTNIQLWRARIGCFLQPVKRRNFLRTLKVFGSKFSLSLRLVLALGVLLIMAGVEQNPGPPKKTGAGAPTQPSVSTRQTRLTSNDTGNLSFTQRGMQSPGAESADGDSLTLFTMLTKIQGELKQLNESYTSLNTRVNELLINLNTETQNNRKANDMMQKRLVSMERRVEYLESQSRRNNLIFHGFNEDSRGSVETWDECEEKVLKYLRDELSLVYDGSEIERAHRLGGTGNQRPIIVKFLSYKGKERIKSKIKQMQTDDGEWVNPHRVSDDFAPGVREDRKELFKYMKLARGEEREAYITFNKLMIDGADFRYPKQSYLMLKNLDDCNRITWATSIRNLLCRYGFGYVWIAQGVGDIDNFIQIFKKRVKDNLLQEWYSDVNETSKAYHYKNFKCIFESEKYLSLDIPAKYIHTFSKFRCSSHKLFVETGRHRDISYQQRICSLCTLHEIEDEFHFMCICPLYSDVRERFFPNKYKYCRMSLDMFYEMMKTKNDVIISQVMKYVFYAFIKREENKTQQYHLYVI